MPEIRVILKEAKSLEIKDLNGKADPFAELSIVGGDDSQLVKSKVVKKDLTPIWNETFNFTIKNPLKEALRIHLKDSDLLQNDTMGIALFRLDNLVKDKPVEAWLELRHCRHGSVKVVVTALDFNSADYRRKKPSNDGKFICTIDLLSLYFGKKTDLIGKGEYYIKTEGDRYPVKGTIDLYKGETWQPPTCQIYSVVYSKGFFKNCRDIDIVIKEDDLLKDDTLFKDTLQIESYNPKDEIKELLSSDGTVQAVVRIRVARLRSYVTSE